jgi:CRP/FNR family transcriptional regulator
MGDFPGMNVRKVLDNAPFFRQASEQTLEKLTRVCRLKRLRKRERLFAEGDRGSAMYLLASGHVGLYKTTPEGTEACIKVVRRGEVFAEVVLFEQDRYPVTAVALTAATVVEWLTPDVHALLDRRDFRTDFIGMLMRKQRYLAGQVRNLAARDVEERLRLFLRSHYGERETIRPELTKKDIAGAIGVAPETLSRLLRRLQEAGLLRWEGRAITVEPEYWTGEGGGS